MREGWKTAAIEDIAQVVNGGTPKTNVPEYWDGRHLWITPAEMGRLDSPYIAISRRKLTDAGLQNSSASLVPKNSVILSTRAPIGHLVINDEPMAFNQGCRGLVPRQQVHYKYLYYFLFSSVDLLNELGSGTTFKELAAGKLKKVMVPLPTLPEQKRIVAILDEAFAGIATAVANTEKNLANARELFESYLNSAFGRLHDTCEVKAISQIAAVKGGKRVPKGYKLETSPTAFPYITVSAFTDDGGIDPSGVKYIDEVIYKQISRYIIRTSDVYISIAGTIGKTGIIPDDLDGANLTENACRLVFEPGIFNRFIYFFTRTQSFADQALKNTRVTAQPKLALERLKTITLPIPQREVQQQMVSEFDGLLTELRRLESIQHQKLIALAELKQSLLQKAFSGELTATLRDEIETALA